MSKSPFTDWMEEEAEKRRAKHAAARRKWVAENPEAMKAHQKKFHAKNRHRQNEYARQYRAKHATKLNEATKLARKRRSPERIQQEQLSKRVAAYRRRYGIGIEDYDQMLMLQNHHCALCDRTPEQELYGRLNVDHDHRTGVIRGLLCTPCNHALGVLGDDVEGLERAIDYLQKPREIPCQK